MEKYIRANQDIDTSVLSLETMWKAINNPKLVDVIGVTPPKSFLEIINGTTINYFVEQKSAEKFIDDCVRVLNSLKTLEKIRQKTLSVSSEMQNYARKLCCEIDNLNDQDIPEILQKIANYEFECATFGIAIAFADFRGDVTNKLLEIVSKRQNLKHPTHVYSSILGLPKERSQTELAYEDIKSGQKPDDQLLQEYFWLDQGYIGRGLNQAELEKIKLGKSSQPEVSSIELEEELNLSDEEKQIFEIPKYNVIIKSLRADARQFPYVIMNRIVDILAEKWQIAPKYIEALYTDELVRILKGEIPFPKDIQDRFKHSVILTTKKDDFYEILIGRKAYDYLEEHLLIEEIKDKETIKGQVAYPGHVKGKVRLLFGPQHNDKIKEGDILISTATSPQLLPAMKLAAAFITDIGGITSHAAIVARELKKPCIVGTKYATQLLKDGDLVEVDAKQGIINIVKEPNEY